MRFRILNTLLVVVVSWWAWTGPMREYRDKSMQEELAANARMMQVCLHGEAFAEGAGAGQGGDPEQRCAARHGLYRYQGQWWSYARTGVVRYSKPSS